MRDVIVVGAGPGGSAAAYYMARRGLDVLLIDRSEFPRDKTCGDGLTPRALGVLDDMGMLGSLSECGWRTSQIAIVAPRGYSVSAAVPADGGWPSYALIVPRLLLDDAIRERALAAGAAFEGRVRVEMIERDGAGVRVLGERSGAPLVLRARAAVVATGASFKLLMRIGVLERPPQLALAARAYYEGIPDLLPDAQFRFDGVPLPGYGWIFPISGSGANIGAGIFEGGWRARRDPAAARKAFDRFVATPTLARLLRFARRAGPVKGYPLRVDFARAPTYGDRVLLVGEAAGLVNPLTGEGIDYALESGRIAAEHLADRFAVGDLSEAAFAAYDGRLRERFQRLFVFCERTRAVFVNRLLLDGTVRLARRRPDLRQLLTAVVLGGHKAPDAGLARMLLRALAALR